MTLPLGEFVDIHTLREGDEVEVKGTWRTVRSVTRCCHGSVRWHLNFKHGGTVMCFEPGVALHTRRRK